MSWYEKDQKTPFDNTDIDGLMFLSGAYLDWIFDKPSLKDKKFPQVAFPSDMIFPIWEGNIIHLFGEMDLGYFSTRDEAFGAANHIAEACGYAVRKVDENQLELTGHDVDEHLLVTYNNEQGRMIDVAPAKTEYTLPQHPAHNLLPDEIREKLPPLYANEELGLMALAVVKYFTPTSNYTWYASEFDGDDLFYGLVAGHFVELGYFSLSELQSIGGGLTLPVERDLYFEPKTLKELKDWHEKNQ